VLSDLIRDNQPCVALTGAGVSTESGIPDFRSADGIWAQYDPMEYASIEAFRRDPVKVWEFYGKRLGALLEAKPNAAHDALAELERRGLLSAVITQNIDRLHSLAGSADVVEVHGSIATSVCLRCGTTATLEAVLALLEDAPAPACPSCGAILKPNVVMFGELLPAVAIDRAFELARSARLLLVVGSTLEVYPVAGLPLETIGAGGAVAIVNRGPTALDELAELRIEGTAGEILGRALDELR
jgi:NAD-dependent protein deacetylase/lipoamidase